MDVALPHGQTAQFRDVLMRGDIREARRGMVFVTNADGSRRTDGAFMDDLTGRIIARMLVGWSLDSPLPGNAQGEHLTQQILDRLDAETYSALEDAVVPWLDRIISLGKSSFEFTHTASGVRVKPVDEADAGKLTASGEFTAAEALGAGPKSTRTAISSSAPPEQPGPTTTE